MQVRCGDCHKVLDLEKGYVPNSDFWNKHGCMPGKVEFICVCGAEHNTGFYVYPDVKVAAHELALFIIAHEGHESSKYQN